MDFHILVAFISGLVFCVAPFFIRARGTVNTLLFRVAPFLLGIANFASFMILSGFVVKG